MEWPGLNVSTLASTMAGTEAVTLFSLMRGVFPMVSSMLLHIFMWQM
jgi:hypothetical protein